MIQTTILAPCTSCGGSDWVHLRDETYWCRACPRTPAIPFELPAEADPEHRRQYQEATRYVQAAYRMAENTTLGQKPWKFVPPTSDDPATWEGIARWAGAWQAFIWWSHREASLRFGGPFYCPAHKQKRPGNGWLARNCFDCAWHETLHDEALELARKMAREHNQGA